MDNITALKEKVNEEEKRIHAIEDLENKHNCFGTVTWTMEDLESALENEDVPATKENLSFLYDVINYDIEKFQSAIVQEGLYYIYGVIRDLAECGDLETH